MMMTNQTYDIINKVQRWLYALGVFYLGLCKIWGFSFGDQVNQTLVLVGTLLASVLEISTAQYKKTLNNNTTGFDGDPKGGEAE